MKIARLTLALAAALLVAPLVGPPSRAAENVVVATVGGVPITAADLQQELQTMGLRNGAADDRQRDQAVLQQLIVRRLLGAAARRDGLDQTPDYKSQAARSDENILLQLYQRKIASGVAAPTRPEAEAFVAAHPEMFSGRRLLTIDQVVAETGGASPGRFKSIHTLKELKTLLNGEKTPFQVAATVVDTLNADPKVVAQLDQAAKSDILVTPRGSTLVFNQLSEARAAPLGGETAVTYATNILRSQRAQEAVRQATEAMVKAAGPSIVFSPGYQPTSTAAPK